MLESTIQNEIQRYISAISIQRDAIASLSSHTFTVIHRQTLFLCLLDTMAKSVFPNENNQKRFKEFTKQFCNWKHCTYVSLPHLITLLNKEPDNQLAELYQYAKRKFNGWPMGRPVTLDYDLPYEEAESLWPSDYVFKGFKLEYLTHSHLLWKLRNSLVHEMRLLGRSTDLFAIRDPHYVGRIELYQDPHTEVMTSNGYARELYYPTEFFLTLINKALLKISKYCMEKEIDPFAVFKFDSMWLDFD